MKYAIYYAVYETIYNMTNWLCRPPLLWNWLDILVILIEIWAFKYAIELAINFIRKLTRRAKWILYNNVFKNTIFRRTIKKKII